MTPSPTRRRTSPSSSPPATATIPPPVSCNRCTANSMSSSSMPTTSRLWLSWATVLAAALGGVIVLVLLANTNTLFTLFTASTIMPALLYAGTVLLYIATRRGQSRFGRWEWPVIIGAVIWLGYELIVLIGPAAFRDAQYYVLGTLGLGLIFYVLQLMTEPEAMRSTPEVQ